MKLSNLLYFTLLTLTACQQPTKIDPTPAPLPVSKESTKEIYEGSSGLVRLKFVQPENTQLELPEQIKVIIEKTDASNSNLSLTEYPDSLVKFLFATNSNVASFGCHPEDATTLPKYLNADRVILCGKIKIPSGKFEMRASTLELRDAEILTESTPVDLSGLKPLPSVTIYTANFIVSGSNSLTLEGWSNGVERTSAPALFLNIGITTGDGTISILSRKLLKLM